MKSSLWIAATAVVLSACGGGSGGGDGGIGLTPPPAPAPAPAPSPAPAPAPAPAAQAISYQALPASPSFLSQLNAEGANGWNYVSGIIYTTGTTNVDLSVLFAKRLNTTYSFELPSNAGSTAELQQQLNAQGARGFSYAGPDTLGAIYRKDNGSSSTYSYRVLPEPADNTVDGLLAQDKAQGAEGYYHLGSSLIVGNDTVRIFQKDSQSTATYDVEVLPSATTNDAFMAQLEAQGARGFRFKSDYGFGDNVIRALYEKDTTQSATFSYAALTSAANANDLVTQANAQGANGVVLIGDLGLPSGTIKTLYVTPSACSGLLCGVRSAFGF